MRGEFLFQKCAFFSGNELKIDIFSFTVHNTFLYILRITNSLSLNTCKIITNTELPFQTCQENPVNIREHFYNFIGALSVSRELIYQPQETYIVPVKNAIKFLPVL